MRTAPVVPDELKTLPRAIWMAGSTSFYRGSPIEMVRQMAEEMGAPSVRDAVGTLLTALYRNRGILIGIPEDAPDEILAALFVYALLNTGVGRPMVQS